MGIQSHPEHSHKQIDGTLGAGPSTRHVSSQSEIGQSWSVISLAPAVFRSLLAQALAQVLSRFKPSWAGSLSFSSSHHASVVPWLVTQTPRFSGFLILAARGLPWLHWLWPFLSLIILFREFLFVSWLESWGFLVFLSWFTKFGVGISLGLDHFTFSTDCVVTGLNLNWLHALVDSSSCFVLSGVAAWFYFFITYLLFISWSGPYAQQVPLPHKLIFRFRVIFDKMSINVKTQQAVIDALSRDCKNHRKTVLCHTPSEVRTDAEIFISSQDRLVELFTGEIGSTIAVFPNMSFVRGFVNSLCMKSFQLSLSLLSIHTVIIACLPLTSWTSFVLKLVLSLKLLILLNCPLAPSGRSKLSLLI